MPVTKQEALDYHRMGGPGKTGYFRQADRSDSRRHQGRGRERHRVRRVLDPAWRFIFRGALAVRAKAINEEMIACGGQSPARHETHQEAKEGEVKTRPLSPLP